MEKTPKIGICTIIKNHKGEILLGHRISEHGYDTWSVPGGHLEMFETPEECAKREAFEEVNLIITDLKPDGYTNNFFEETGKHYITLYFVDIVYNGTLKRKEPKKCSKWEWFAMDKLPENIFPPLRNYFDKVNYYK